MRIKSHNDSSSTSIYSIIFYWVHVYTNRKKKKHDKGIFSSWHIYVCYKDLTTFFYLLLFHAKKKSTTNNFSEEHLGNVHISLHIISKIIQSILGYLPEQLLSLVFCYPFPRSKSLAHPTPAFYKCLSHLLSLSVSITTSLYGQESLPCFTDEKLKLRKGKWWLIRMAGSTTSQTASLLILTFDSESLRCLDVYFLASGILVVLVWFTVSWDWKFTNFSCDHPWPDTSLLVYSSDPTCLKLFGTGPVIISNQEIISSRKDSGIESGLVITFVTPQLILWHNLIRFPLYSIIHLCSYTSR